jgi:hypothetical protein
MRAARDFDMPFSFSFSYCFSFLTFADLEAARIGVICGASACREVKQAQVP